MTDPEGHAWAEALKALSRPQLRELVAKLGDRASYIPSVDGDTATVALAIVQQMRFDLRIHEIVSAELLRANALPAALRVDRWLTVQWERHREVPVVGGRGEQYKLPIDDIYVPLSLADRSAFGDEQDRHTIALHGRGGSSSLSVEAAFAELERRRGKGSLLCGISVVGKPGAGKTTLLSRVVSLATPAPRGAGSSALGLPGELVPVYLRLASLWRRALGPPRQSLETLLQAAIDERVPGAGPALLSRTRRLLILLDGLDEVPDETARVEVCQWLVAQLPDWRADARFVVTCRHAAWDRADQELRSSLLPFSVQGFDRPAVERYVRRWFPLVYQGYHARASSEAEAEADAARQADDLLDAVWKADAEAAWRLETMARNPLLLSVMCLVHLQRGQLPHTRRQLYEECLSILLETWHKHQGRLRPVRTEPALRALAPLAWRMQCARATGEQDATSLSEAEVTATLAPLLRPESGLDLDPQAFLSWLGQNGVLESPDVGRWRYSHLTFQEYLAARHAGERNLEAELATHLEEAWWRETILLAVAQSGFYARFLEAAWVREPGPEGLGLLRAAREESGSEDPGPHLRVLHAAAASPGLLTRLLRGLGFGDPGPPVWRVLLALDLAPEAAGEAIKQAARPLLHHPDLRVTTAVAELLGEAPPTHEAAPRPGERRVFVAAGVRIEAVWVPAGAFWMGSSKVEGEDGYDAEAYTSELPRHQVTIPWGLWLGRFPVTNAQYAAFVRKMGVREPYSMLNSGFDGPKHPVLDVDWHEARDFCAWWSAQPGAATADLPTEAEWEWAARGADGRRYPWGNDAPDPSRAQYESRVSAPVGAHPAGRGPFGAEDQAGNTWEWCRTASNRYRAKERTDNWRDDDLERNSPRVLRGGSWVHDARDVRAADRVSSDPRNRYLDFGFRVVFRPTPPPAIEP